MSQELKTQVGPETGDGERPLVSVIIPTYNYAHFIGEAIQSVLDQTYRNFEIVVVDDGSTDNTGEVVAQFPAVRYLPQPNQGIAAARNTGLRSTSGDFLVFLDADDRLLPQALESGLAFLEKQPNCVFVSGHWELIDLEGRPLPSPPPAAIHEDHYRAFLNYNYIGTVGQVMFRRALFSTEAWFDPTVPGCDDAELYLRIAKKYPVAAYDQIVVQHRNHGGNTSSDRVMMLKSMETIYGRQLREVQGNPLLEELCKEGITLCRKFLSLEQKKRRRARVKSNPLAHSLLQLKHRIKAAIIFERYQRQRSKQQDTSA